MTPEQDEVLNAAKRMFHSVADGVLKLVKTHTVDGQDTWDVVHVPNTTNPVTEMALGSLRKGQITVTPTVAGSAYSLNIYGGLNSFMKDGEDWVEVAIRERPKQVSPDMMNRVLEKIREHHQNALFLNAEKLFDDRTLLIKAVDSSTREEIVTLVSLTKDGKDIEDVRFPNETAGLSL